MSERPTPETDKAKCKFTSLFGDDEDAYWVPLKVARRLERELEAERALAEMYRRKCSKLTSEHEALQEQLEAAVMLGKLQERRHQREVEVLTTRGIHTCHDQCQRPLCVMRRELQSLKGGLAAWVESPEGKEKAELVNSWAAVKAVLDRIDKASDQTS